MFKIAIAKFANLKMIFSFTAKSRASTSPKPLLNPRAFSLKVNNYYTFRELHYQKCSMERSTKNNLKNTQIV